jgi:hypothetical protein
MTDEREHAFQAYSKIAEQIEKEDGLVNQRLTWGASINGALFALLGVLFKDLLLDASILANISGCVIAVFLSIIGVLVCGSSIRGIVDARKQIDHIRSIYKEWWQPQVENEMHLPRPFFERHENAWPAWQWWSAWSDRLLRPVGLDTKTLGKDSWWGDDLFRLMIGLWVFVIVVSVSAVIARLIGRALTS